MQAQDNGHRGAGRPASQPQRTAKTSGQFPGVQKRSGIALVRRRARACIGNGEHQQPRIVAFGQALRAQLHAAAFRGPDGAGKQLCQRARQRGAVADILPRKLGGDIPGQGQILALCCGRHGVVRFQNDFVQAEACWLRRAGGRAHSVGQRVGKKPHAHAQSRLQRMFKQRVQFLVQGVQALCEGIGRRCSGPRRRQILDDEGRGGRAFVRLRRHAGTALHRARQMARRRKQRKPQSTETGGKERQQLDKVRAARDVKPQGQKAQRRQQDSQGKNARTGNFSQQRGKGNGPAQQHSERPQRQQADKPLGVRHKWRQGQQQSANADGNQCQIQIWHDILRLHHLTARVRQQQQGNARSQQPRQRLRIRQPARRPRNAPGQRNQRRHQVQPGQKTPFASLRNAPHQAQRQQQSQDDLRPEQPVEPQGAYVVPVADGRGKPRGGHARHPEIDHGAGLRNLGQQIQPRNQRVESFRQRARGLVGRTAHNPDFHTVRKLAGKPLVKIQTGGACLVGGQSKPEPDRTGLVREPAVRDRLKQLRRLRRQDGVQGAGAGLIQKPLQRDRTGGRIAARGGSLFRKQGKSRGKQAAQQKQHNSMTEEQRASGVFWHVKRGVRVAVKVGAMAPGHRQGPWQVCRY